MYTISRSKFLFTCINACDFYFSSMQKEKEEFIEDLVKKGRKKTFLHRQRLTLDEAIAYFEEFRSVQFNIFEAEYLKFKSLLDQANAVGSNVLIMLDDEDADEINRLADFFGYVDDNCTPSYG